MTAWISYPVAPPSALVPNAHDRGASGVLCDQRTTPLSRPARRWSRMMEDAREAVRSLDVAIDFGTWRTNAYFRKQRRVSLLISR